MKNTLSLLVIMVLLFTSCNDYKKEFRMQLKITILKKDTIHAEQKLMETYYYAYHDAKTSEDKILTPPIIAI